jgi:hypothetical protein
MSKYAAPAAVLPWWRQWYVRSYSSAWVLMVVQHQYSGKPSNQQHQKKHGGESNTARSAKGQHA